MKINAELSEELKKIRKKYKQEKKKQIEIY